MPAQSFVAPDMRSWDGRGWEPERTYHTPRIDAESTKSKSGRWIPPSERAQPDWYAQPGVRSSRQGGHGGHFSRSASERVHPPDFPQPGSWGATGYGNDGFHPELRPRHGNRDALPFEAPFPRRSASPLSTRRTSGLSPRHPLMMDGAVVLGGCTPNRNLHHNLTYQSPDRALVGDEEIAARAKADRARLRQRAQSPSATGGPGAAALHARQRALSAAEKRRIHVPRGVVTNKTHGSHEPASQRCATPITMQRAVGY